MNKFRARLCLLAVLFFICHLNTNAQNTISGHIISENGNPIEYVSVWFQADSVGTISDANGNFTLELKKPCKGNIELTHVSYNRTIVPYDVWYGKKTVTIKMNEKLVKLPEVSVSKENKERQITGAGMRGPGNIAFVVNKDIAEKKSVHHILEVGPVFRTNKNYILSFFSMEVRASTFDKCTVNFNIYDINDDKGTNILSRPIYYELKKNVNKQTIKIYPREEIQLKKDHRYWISVRVVNCTSYGNIILPTHLKSNYFRNVNSGKKKHYPGGLGIDVYGYVTK